jgi:hypothetical protein
MKYAILILGAFFSCFCLWIGWQCMQHSQPAGAAGIFLMVLGFISFLCTLGAATSSEADSAKTTKPKSNDNHKPS